MPPAAVIAPQTHQFSATAMVTPPPPSFAKDAVIAWFRGEFAAANAIIDALCIHLSQLQGVAGEGSEYGSVFAAIHRRRMNWIPILQMQNFYSIADVSLELRRVAERKAKDRQDHNGCLGQEKTKSIGESMQSDQNVGVEDLTSQHSSHTHSDITYTTAPQEVQHEEENIMICSDHRDCETRQTQIKITKGFIAKEPVKGHMINVVKGLKLYDEIFNDRELGKLNEFVSELRAAGESGELSGETFILYNQQKGRKRELIQLGIPIYGHMKENTAGQIEPIPSLLRDLIDHLILWHLIPENRKPNSCIINFFDEDDYSLPFQKPPHLDQPLTTLLLSECTMAFGRALASHQGGNYKASLMLSLKPGSLLVMRGNSADLARHVMCSTPNKRVTITFFSVRSETVNGVAQPPSTKDITLWQRGKPSAAANGTFNGHGKMHMVPKCGLVRTPVIMLATARPIVLSSRRMTRGGTGVFLPWTVESGKPAKHRYLPPRAQRGRLPALPNTTEADNAETSSGSSINLD